MSGQELKVVTYSYEGNTLKLNISELSPGFYILNLKESDGKLSSIKFHKAQ